MSSPKYFRVLQTALLMAPGVVCGQPATQSDHLSSAERWVARGTVAASALVALDDAGLRNGWRAPKVESNQVRAHIFGVARTAGSPGVFIGAAALYGIGRVTQHPVLADAGWHASEAIIASGMATQLLKGVVGRERPYASEGHPARFEMGAGFRDGTHASFPSGHTSASFAMASALTSEVARHNRAHPWRTWLVGSLAYGGAMLIGVSRMYHDAHWASDVVAGAGVGTLSGLMLTRRAHLPHHKMGRLDRWVLGQPASR